MIEPIIDVPVPKVPRVAQARTKYYKVFTRFKNKPEWENLKRNVKGLNTNVLQNIVQYLDLQDLMKFSIGSRFLYKVVIEFSLENDFLPEVHKDIIK